MQCWLVLVLLSLTATASDPSQTEWATFKLQHHKTYNPKEETVRYRIFQDNLRTIAEHNTLYEQNGASYKMAVNQFADMTAEEFTKSNGYQYKARTTGNAKFNTLYQPPVRIDWREKGAVGEVKNQGVCGACWAFSATGALEGQNFFKTGKFVSLSEQELVDCIIERSTKGCNGGFVDKAYQYVIENGLSSEEEYPYEEMDNLCHRDSLPTSIDESGYVMIYGDEETLKQAVGTIGPVSVGVDSTKWQFYSGGIFYDETCEKDPNLLNHAVLVVGYDEEDGNDYWIVKNSYGVEWGEMGYIRLRRNANNTCGIASTPSYPVL